MNSTTPTAAAKARNKFHRLTAGEQQQILDLCEKETYEKVIELIARPRAEGGLALETSISGLSRFYTTYNPEAVRCRQNAQFSKSVQIRHQREGKAMFEATLAMVQNRIVETLKAGRALTEMEKEFRILKTAHKTFLEDDKWRREKEVDPTKAYDDFLGLTLHCPEADFVRNDVPSDPGASDTTVDDFDRETDEDFDLGVWQEKQELQRKQRAALAEAKKAIEAAYAARTASTPAQTPAAATPESPTPSTVPPTSQSAITQATQATPSQLGTPSAPPLSSELHLPSLYEKFAALRTDNSTISHQKTPVFSHFSPKILPNNFSPPLRPSSGNNAGKIRIKTNTAT